MKNVLASSGFGQLAGKVLMIFVLVGAMAAVPLAAFAQYDDTDSSDGSTQDSEGFGSFGDGRPQGSSTVIPGFGSTDDDVAESEDDAGSMDVSEDEDVVDDDDDVSAEDSDVVGSAGSGDDAAADDGATDDAAADEGSDDAAAEEDSGGPGVIDSDDVDEEEADDAGEADDADDVEDVDEAGDVDDVDDADDIEGGDSVEDFIGDFNGIDPVGTIAEIIGTTPEDVMAALAEGQTLAEFSEANGVSADDLVSSLLAEIQMGLDEAVAAGHLTQVQADEMLANITGLLSSMVNGDILGSLFGSDDPVDSGDTEDPCALMPQDSGEYGATAEGDISTSVCPAGEF